MMHLHHFPAGLGKMMQMHHSGQPEQGGQCVQIRRSVQAVTHADKVVQALRASPGYLSCKEVAALLHVSPATVSRWARAHRLPYVRTLGGHRRYPSEAIAFLLEQLALVPKEPAREQAGEWP